MEPFDCAQDRLREIQESVFSPDSAALHLGYVAASLHSFSVDALVGWATAERCSTPVRAGTRTYRP